MQTASEDAGVVEREDLVRVGSEPLDVRKNRTEDVPPRSGGAGLAVSLDVVDIGAFGDGGEGVRSAMEWARVRALAADGVLARAAGADTPLGAGQVRVGRRLQESDQFADGVVAVLWVAQRELAVDLVLVATSDAGLGQIAGLLELVDDLPDRSLGDADGGGDVPQACAGVGGDAGEHMRVVGDEPPKVIVISRT
jgi:hypothetical protein